MTYRDLSISRLKHPIFIGGLIIAMLLLLKNCSYFGEEYKEHVVPKKKEFVSDNSFNPTESDMVLRNTPEEGVPGGEGTSIERASVEVTPPSVWGNLVPPVFTTFINQFKSLILPLNNGLRQAFSMFSGTHTIYSAERDRHPVDVDPTIRPTNDDVVVIHTLPVETVVVLPHGLGVFAGGMLMGVPLAPFAPHMALLAEPIAEVMGRAHRDGGALGLGRMPFLMAASGTVPSAISAGGSTPTTGATFPGSRFAFPPLGTVHSATLKRIPTLAATGILASPGTVHGSTPTSGPSLAGSRLAIPPLSTLQQGIANLKKIPALVLNGILGTPINTHGTMPTTGPSLAGSRLAFPSLSTVHSAPLKRIPTLAATGILASPGTVYGSTPTSGPSLAGLRIAFPSLSTASTGALVMAATNGKVSSPNYVHNSAPSSRTPLPQPHIRISPVSANHSATLKRIPMTAANGTIPSPRSVNGNAPTTGAALANPRLAFSPLGTVHSATLTRIPMTAASGTISSPRSVNGNTPTTGAPLAHSRLAFSPLSTASTGALVMTAANGKVSSPNYAHNRTPSSRTPMSQPHIAIPPVSIVHASAQNQTNSLAQARNKVRDLTKQILADLLARFPGLLIPQNIKAAAYTGTGKDLPGSGKDDEHDSPSASVASRPQTAPPNVYKDEYYENLPHDLQQIINRLSAVNPTFAPMDLLTLALDSGISDPLDLEPGSHGKVIKFVGKLLKRVNIKPDALTTALSMIDSKSQEGSIDDPVNQYLKEIGRILGINKKDKPTPKPGIKIATPGSAPSDAVQTVTSSDLDSQPSLENTKINIPPILTVTANVGNGNVPSSTSENFVESDPVDSPFISGMNPGLKKTEERAPAQLVNNENSNFVPGSSSDSSVSGSMDHGTSVPPTFDPHTIGKVVEFLSKYLKNPKSNTDVPDSKDLESYLTQGLQLVIGCLPKASPAFAYLELLNAVKNVGIPNTRKLEPGSHGKVIKFVGKLLKRANIKTDPLTSALSIMDLKPLEAFLNDTKNPYVKEVCRILNINKNGKPDSQPESDSHPEMLAENKIALTAMQLILSDANNSTPLPQHKVGGIGQVLTTNTDSSAPQNSDSKIDVQAAQNVVPALAKPFQPIASSHEDKRPFWMASLEELTKAIAALTSSLETEPEGGTESNTFPAASLANVSESSIHKNSSLFLQGLKTLGKALGKLISPSQNEIEDKTIIFPQSNNVDVDVDFESSFEAIQKALKGLMDGGVLAAKLYNKTFDTLHKTLRLKKGLETLSRQDRDEFVRSVCGLVSHFQGIIDKSKENVTASSPKRGGANFLTSLFEISNEDSAEKSALPAQIGTQLVEKDDGMKSLRNRAKPISVESFNQMFSKSYENLNNGEPLSSEPKVQHLVNGIIKDVQNVIPSSPLPSRRSSLPPSESPGTKQKLKKSATFSGVTKKDIDDIYNSLRHQRRGPSGKKLQEVFGN